MVPTAQDHNESIKTFLNRYCNQDANPSYAVMLRGPWGSGKTWFIDNYRKELEKKDKRVLYVSFFGVSKISEIKDQFFAQIHPRLASQTAKRAWGITKSLIKGTIKIDLDRDGSDEGSWQISLPEIEKWASTEGAILVFDDLERSSMKIEDALGFINQFVEHDGYRVIILANETSQLSTPEISFNKIKEKVIGRTFQIQPDSEGAVQHFLTESSSRAANEVLDKNKPQLLAIFNRAGYKNLRQLRQAIFDFCDLWDNLDKKQISKNEKFQRQLVNDCITLSIEYRSGTLTSEDIGELGETDWSAYLDLQSSSDRPEPEREKDRVLKRHGLEYAQPLAIPPSAFREFFETGNLSAASATNALRDSHLLANESTPAWRRLWYLRSLSNSEFEKLANETFAEVDSLKNFDLAELIHSAAILLNLAKIGLIRKSTRQIEIAALKSIKTAISNGAMKPPSQRELNELLRDGSAYGLGFTARDSIEFRGFINNVKTILTTARGSWVKRQVTPWLSMLDTDVALWTKHISRNSDEQIWFSDDPVFHHVSAFIFHKKFINLHVSEQELVQESFTERFTHPNHYAEWLILELPFLVKLRSEMSKNSLLNKKTPKFLSHYTARAWFLPKLDESISSLATFKNEISKKPLN